MAETPSGANKLTTASLSQLGVMGTVYVILAYLSVTHLVPWLYAQGVPQAGLLQSFGLILAVLAAAIAAVYGWRALFPKAPGLRAAVAVGVGNVIIGFLLIFIIGYILDGIFGGLLQRLGQDMRMYIGWAILLVIAFFWIRYILRTFNGPSFPKRMQKIEDGGWFTGAPYKKSIAQKIRRITMAAIILTVGLGIWYYYIRPGIGSLSENTKWDIPFVDTHWLIIFRAAALTVPVLLLVFAIWFSYRLVNNPTFAEFLINTEAELAKVTWTTRKRLIRDTGVVLVTVLILAGFLYFLDILWTFVLTLIGVLRR